MENTSSNILKNRNINEKQKHFSNNEMDNQINNCFKSKQINTNKNAVDNNNQENIDTTLLMDLSKCFSDTSDDQFKGNSQDLFLESSDDDMFEEINKKRSQSTPLNPITKPEKRMKLSAKRIEIDPQTNKDQSVCKDDPFNESLNITYFNLNEMHMKNLEKSAINDDSKIENLSEIGKTSQYKKEVLESFNALDSTICHVNEDLFKDNLDICQNAFNVGDSEWDHKINETTQSEFDNAFDPSLPNNLTQLFDGIIQKQNSSVAASSNWNESMMNRSSQIPVKKNRTPLRPEHFGGEFYGLPPSAKSLILQYKGIDKLYEWQNECLKLPAIENRENLIYALPTSGGKTLVAEILMLREVVCRKKNVLFILPFVSIVQEKVWGLSPFAVGLDFLVEEYAAGKGTFPPRKRRTRKSIYIATLEKGLSLVRSLFETKRLHELGLIVVDELHLVGEPTRGCTLEMLLTNVMYSGEDIQIVGMSATIGNIDELAKFLGAYVFLKDFRPVELKEYIKLDESIMRINWNATDSDERVMFDRKINYGYSSQVEKIDPDHLGGLVMEVIPNGSCLIFCPTKKNCENVAVLLCKVIFKKLLEHKADEKRVLERLLRAEGCGEDILLSLLPWGVAYHHSGLAAEERRLIEDAFRNGVLSVLCCTSTLAAGVNLPAQRVILRAPMVGRDFISLSTYKQMVGRAGRAGFGGHGDSILICQSSQIGKVKELINSPMDKANSSLHCNDGGNIRSLILAAIALEIANTRRTLRMLSYSSLLSVQAERLNVNVKQLLDKTIEMLFKLGAIHKKKSKLSNGAVSDDILDSINLSPHTRNSLAKTNFKRMDRSSSDKCITVSNDTELVVSRLGKAAIKGSLELQRAHMLYADLKVAQQSLVLIGVSHILYLVTPYDLSENIRPNLSNYYSVVTAMDAESKYTAKVIGLTESVAIQMAKGKMPKSVSERVLNRFYVTLMLYDLWNQVPLLEVSEKFQVNRGMVQSLMTGVATFASSVLRFCEELEEFWAFKNILLIFNQRLSHFCTLELVPLMELPSVKKSRAIQLYKAGFKTIQAIAQAKPIDLIESIEHINRNVAKQLIAAAKLLLLEKVENLREEAEEVMIGLDNK